MPASKPEPVRLALARDPALVAEIARRILNAHFPEGIRQDVADAVGLSLDAENAATAEQSQRRRDPAFREKVLLACEYRCCVCGHDLRMGGHEWVGTSGAVSRAHQVVPGPRVGRGAERACALARCTTRSSTSARSPCCRGNTRSCSAAT